ncbi:hypothetical protein KQI84_15670 [bacterium]|nr:hypothetical protein [bacterium]
MGIVCSAFLIIGGITAIAAGGRSWINWSGGAYFGSYFSASILLYAFLFCLVQFLLHGWKRRAVWQIVLLILFASVLLVFHFCFLDKVRGVVIWPM